jgi:hypothetical protein
MSALIGLSLGTATGISLAIFSTPANASISLNDLNQVHFIGNEAPVSASTRSDASTSANTGVSHSVTNQAQQTTPTETLASASQPGIGASDETGTRTASGDSSTIARVKTEHSPATENSSPAKIPTVDDDEAPIHPAAPAERLPLKRPVAHPVTKPPRVVLAGDSIDESAIVEEAAVSLDGDAKPAVFYSEGDLTIVDFDSAKGTIETIDGKTFVLGLTISSADATGWEDYRSNVHYRCSQDGSCTLTRSGVVAPNARMI